jgi:hypothetical protein
VSIPVVQFRNARGPTSVGPATVPQRVARERSGYDGQAETSAFQTGLGEDAQPFIQLAPPPSFALMNENLGNMFDSPVCDSFIFSCGQ